MSDNFELLRPKKGMTSVEAAYAFLEEQDRQQAEKQSTFSLDALARSGLARRMGFDFDVTIDHSRKRFICVDTSSGYKTTAYYQEMDEKAIKRLVRALGRLKKIHDDRI